MEGLRSLLEGTGGARVVAAETNLEDAAGALAELHPDMLLVDKKFAHRALAELLRRTESTAAVIVWGQTVSEKEAFRLVRSGASGVVSKTASLRDLAECVRAVACGRKWLEGAAASRFLN
jgi:DNA-binding NarL/FixJ family response regulator